MIVSQTEFDGLVDSIKTLNAEDGFRPRLDATQWRTLAGYMTRHTLKAGDLLIKQGETDRAMYLLGSGTCSVYVDGAKPGSKVALLRPGSMCGEPSLFAEGPRTANVEAMTPIQFWALRLPRLEELSLRVPPLALEIIRAAGAVMAVRMRAAMARQQPMS